MPRTAKTRAPLHARSVGTAEFRANLAKYLKQVRAGTPVVVQERGRDAYLVSRLDESPTAPVLGCMRERTEYVSGAVVSAVESWSSGSLP